MKHLLNLALFFFFLNPILSKAQDYFQYNRYCNVAAQFIEDGQFDLAVGQLYFAYDFVDKPLLIDQFHMAKCYSQLEERDSVIHYLDLIVGQESRIDQLIRLHNLWFEPILGKHVWEEYLKKSNANYVLHPTEIDELYQ